MILNKIYKLLLMFILETSNIINIYLYKTWENLKCKKI